MSDRLKDLATFNEEYEKLSDSRRNESANSDRRSRRLSCGAMTTAIS